MCVGVFGFYNMLFACWLASLSPLSLMEVSLQLECKQNSGLVEKETTTTNVGVITDQHRME